jgi:hypothetical protein
MAFSGFQLIYMAHRNRGCLTAYKVITRGVSVEVTNRPLPVIGQRGKLPDESKVRMIKQDLDWADSSWAPHGTKWHHVSTQANFNRSAERKCRLVAYVFWSHPSDSNRRPALPTELGWLRIDGENGAVSSAIQHLSRLSGAEKASIKIG